MVDHTDIAASNLLTDSDCSVIKVRRDTPSACRTSKKMQHLNLHQIKRKHPPKKDNELSSSEDEVLNPKGNKPSNEKKIKPRLSPPTSDSEVQDLQMNDMKRALPTEKEFKTPQPVGFEESEKFCEPDSKEELKLEPNEESVNKQTKEAVEEKKEEQWKAIDDKRNIVVGHKATRGQFRFDYLGGEVDQDEADALSALNSFWLNTIAKNAAKPKTGIPVEHKDFYNKYCDGTRKLSLEAATRLMSYPHVIAITLKNNAKIEVIVSDTEKALEDSSELREEAFEVVGAMGMHLF